MPVSARACLQDAWELDHAQTDKLAPRCMQHFVKHHGPESRVRVHDVYDGCPDPDKLGEVLGSGGTSEVYRVTHKQSKMPLALKVRFRNEEDDTLFFLVCQMPLRHKCARKLWLVCSLRPRPRGDLSASTGTTTTHHGCIAIFLNCCQQHVTRLPFECGCDHQLQ